ncbi:MAG: hypothetical protein U0746_01935 [Gemmataceae bacterium]
MRLCFALIAIAWTVPACYADDITYSKHIAPILYKHCASCHRAGEVGPFPLLSYKDAAKRAEFLKDITASRQMPPWKAEHGFGEFLDERRLSDEELKTIAKWADSGAPEGDPKDLPPAPTFPEGWHLGKPDLVLTMPQPFTVPAAGRDLQQCFIVPIPITEDKTVVAVDFRPGNRKVVHHAILYLDSTGAARRKAGDAGYYSTFGGPGFLPTGGLGSWAPGAEARRLPEGVGKFIRKGSDLVLQIHYHPNGKEEIDQSSVGVYFATKPAEKLVAGIGLISRTIDIPAGKSDYTVASDSAPLPADCTALSIGPHMHNIGRDMKVEARLPDGSVKPMIHVTDWDWNWQGAYYYKEPVRLPKGTVLHMEARYDNSTANPRNPSNPPKRVRWGEQTTDEMCLCGVQVVTDNKADLLKIVTMRGNQLGLLLGGGVSREQLEGDGPRGDVAIPERFKGVLEQYDKNKDGKLSAEEIEAMPERLRTLVKMYLR